jgi:hypothetical protein
MTNSINPAPILQREARLSLAAIQRQIGGKRSFINPNLVPRLFPLVEERPWLGLVMCNMDFTW